MGTGVASTQTSVWTATFCCNQYDSCVQATELWLQHSITELDKGITAAAGEIREATTMTHTQDADKSAQDMSY
jgi:hypothetical protein